MLDFLIDTCINQISFIIRIGFNLMQLQSIKQNVFNFQKMLSDNFGGLFVVYNFSQTANVR